MKMKLDGEAYCTITISVDNNSKFLNNGVLNKGEIQKILDHILEVAEKYGVAVSLDLDDMLDKTDADTERVKDYADSFGHYYFGYDEWDVGWNYEFELESANLERFQSDCSENLYRFLREIEKENDEGYSIEAYEQCWISVHIDRKDVERDFYGRYKSEDFEGDEAFSGYYKGGIGELVSEEYDRLSNDLKQYTKDLDLEQSQKKKAVKDER